MKKDKISKEEKAVYSFIRWLNGIFKTKSTSLEESVSELIKEHDAYDSVNFEQKEMLQNVVDFKGLRACEVMIPRTDIAGISFDATFDQLRDKFVNESHTRLPVFKANLDEIIGFVHMRDFIDYIGDQDNFSIEKVLRKVIYAPRSMRVINLLAKMRSSAIHIAIILDEYGGTDGLVTIEDLVEEIIGDIRDEHDEHMTPDIAKISDKTWIVESKADIEEVEEVLNISLNSDEEEYETFGGFILSYLGKIPEIGDKFEHPSGISIEIIDADNRRVKKSKVKIE